MRNIPDCSAQNQAPSTSDRDAHLLPLYDDRLKISLKSLSPQPLTLTSPRLFSLTACRNMSIGSLQSAPSIRQSRLHSCLDSIPLSSPVQYTILRFLNLVSSVLFTSQRTSNLSLFFPQIFFFLETYVLEVAPSNYTLHCKEF